MAIGNKAGSEELKAFELTCHPLRKQEWEGHCNVEAVLQCTEPQCTGYISPIYLTSPTQ